MKKPLLTVVIPTRNRRNFLFSTLKKFQKAREILEDPGKVDLLVVNNFSTDGTEQMVREIALSDPSIKYERQKKKRKSAEAAMAFSVAEAKSEYVWVFGDDDDPSQNSLQKLLQELGTGADFFLLNSRILVPNGGMVDYLQKTNEQTKIEPAKELWLQFGFVSATTTLSSLCFKKDLFDLGLFSEFEKISEVYSHSASLFAMFADRAARIIWEPLYVYRATGDEELTKNYNAFSKGKGVPVEYPFAVGLLRLLIKAAAVTGSPLSKLLAAREVEIRKDTWQTSVTTTGGFIKRFLRQRMAHLKKTRFLEMKKCDFELAWCYLVLKAFYKSSKVNQVA